MSEPDPNRIDTGRDHGTRRHPAHGLAPADPPARREPYTFPPELEQYRPYLAHPGREEELVNSTATPFNNWPVFAMHCTTQAEVLLLARLHAAGLLRPAAQGEPQS